MRRGHTLNSFVLRPKRLTCAKCPRLNIPKRAYVKCLIHFHQSLSSKLGVDCDWRLLGKAVCSLWWPPPVIDVNKSRYSFRVDPGLTIDSKWCCAELNDIQYSWSADCRRPNPLLAKKGHAIYFTRHLCRVSICNVRVLRKCKGVWVWCNEVYHDSILLRLSDNIRKIREILNDLECP